MNALERIFLVGMPGAGKTTVGRHLARTLKLHFVDADHEVVERTGVKIPVIFEIEGELGFRDRESRVLAELAQQSGLVVATGGGAVLRNENRRLMRDSGIVIYLHATPALLYERTRHDTNRPLLQVENPLAKLSELYATRDHHYREVADFIVETGNGGVNQLIRRIQTELNKCPD